MQGLLNKEGQYANTSIESIYLPPFLINLAQKYSFEEILISKSVQKNYLTYRELKLPTKVIL